MLEQRDLDTLKSMLESVIDDRFQELKEAQSAMAGDISSLKETQADMANDISDLKSNQEFMLEEIGRTQSSLEKKIEKVEQKIDEIDRFYRIRKIEDGNTGMLIQMYQKLSERVEKLEVKMA